MITYIHGKIFALDADNHLTVLVSGIGYGVYVPKPVHEQAVVGGEITIHTYQHVREDSLDLYGFLHKNDLAFFKQLIQVSGVGPKLALGICSAFEIEAVRRAIIQADSDFLKSIPGVGKKTAERIVLDLQDRLEEYSMPIQSTEGTGPLSQEQLTAVDALESLGYSKQEARAALEGIDSTLLLEEQIRQALQRLAVK